MKKRIVERTIVSLRPCADKNIIEYDGEIPGFGVRVTAAGIKSFILEYRIHGRKRRYTIGRFPELSATAARARALELRGMIYDQKNPRDPMEERDQSRSDPTVKDLATQYLERYAEVKKRAASVRNDRQMINRFILPKIGKLRLKAVCKRDVEALHTSLKSTPYQANRLLSLLSKMFNVAIEWEWMEKNFAKTIPRFHEDRREDCLSIEQIQRFREALDTYSNQNAADALRLLLLTGARPDEVMQAEWEQFDLQRKVWTKPSHHTKQIKIEHIPLNAPTFDLLRRMKPKDATGPLFLGKENEDGEQVARTTLRNPWVQSCKAAGIGEETTVKKGKRKGKPHWRPGLRMYDMRHSFVTHLVGNGVSLQIVGKLVGHTQAATTMRYAHLQDAPLRDATNQLADIYTMTEKKGA